MVYQKIIYFCTRFGEMAEWSIAAVLKTVVPRGTGGSNPSLSAITGVAQLVEHWSPKPGVGRSSRSSRAEASIFVYIEASVFLQIPQSCNFVVFISEKLRFSDTKAESNFGITFE